MRKSLILVFVLVSFILGACFPFGTQPVTSQAPAATPTPPLDRPEGVAQTFLNAWMSGDYSGMYSLLTPGSQAQYTLDEFTDTYTGTAAAMTLNSLEAVPVSVLPETQGTGAQLAFQVTYHTQVLGPIEQNMNMMLKFDSDRWGIVWSPALIFEQLANENTLQLKVESPSRANIYDRNGLPLVTADAQAYTITIVPSQINTNFEDQMLNLLSEVTRMAPAEIRKNYDGMPADHTYRLGDADAETIQAHWSALNSYTPALGFVEKTGRRYFDLLAPHVLGYTSQMSPEQVEEYKKLGYQGDEIIGQAGLEKWGEQYLAGTRGGILSAYTSSGQFFQEIARKDSQPAQSIYTTLDRDLQTMVQDIIQEAYSAGSPTWAPTAGGASVVVLDVKTGAVLAMASYPYYDPNVLNPFNSHPLNTPTYIRELINSPLKPFLNRATQGEYPAGSVFKVVSMSAALGSDLFEPNSPYTCTGVWTGLGANTPRYDWLEGGHGTITLAQALTGSCNPYFYQIGLKTGQEDFDLIPSYARQYGFGQRMGIEIEERPGLMPDPDWLSRERGLTWTLDDSVNVAIGQGNVLVTPLQVASMIATVANGGTVYRPQLVDHIGLLGEEPTVTFEPDVLGMLTLSQDDLAVIRESMRQVAADPFLGTAEYRLGNLQIPVAGKTGTAQVSGAGQPIAWFAGFAPYDEPEIALVVMVENGGNGSTVAAPIFRRIIERWYGKPELKWPSDWGNPDEFNFATEDHGE